MKLLCLALFLGAASQFAKAQAMLPPYSHRVLPNGIALDVMERKGVPLVEIDIAVKGGMESDPADEPGLAGVTADMLRKGTASKTADQFSSAIDALGGTFHARADHQATLIESEFLSKDLAAGLALVSDAVTAPAFRDDEVKKLLAQRIDDVKALKDNPAEAIESYAYSFFFGQSHPYGRIVYETSLARMNREQIVQYYKGQYTGRNIVIAVVGDIQPRVVETEVEKAFGKMETGNSYEWKPPIPLQRPSQARLLLVDKPQATQTYFYIAQPGVERKSVDRIPLQLVNTVFGGRFTSMLNDALRVKSGLTYGAHNIIEKDRLQGMNAISTFSKTGTTAQAIDLALETLKQLHDKGLTADQLASGKAYVKGVFPRYMLETPDQLASLLLQLEIFQLGKEEVSDFDKRIDAITLDQANETVRNHFDSAGLTFVLVGDANKIRREIGKYAPQVREVSIRQAGFGF